MCTKQNCCCLFDDGKLQHLQTLVSNLQSVLNPSLPLMLVYKETKYFQQIMFIHLCLCVLSAGGANCDMRVHIAT